MRKQMVSKLRIAGKTIAVNSACIVFFLLGVILCAAQDKQQTRPSTPSGQTNNEPGNNSISISAEDVDYLIQPNDIIDIKIEDAPELSGTYRLNTGGTFDFPQLGTITVEKITAEQLSRNIADKLRGKYLMNPIVSITVRQRNSHAFFIQGAVRNPGLYRIEGHPTLLKLITIAGGLSENYGSTAFVIREIKQDPATKNMEPVGSDEKAANEKTSADRKTEDETGKFEVIKANIGNLLTKGDFAQNVAIQPGDIVHIPQTDVFFVAGEVKSPGSFPLKEGTTLRQAISLAHGTNYEGKLDQSVIFRDNAKTGKPDEIKINVAAIMAGKQEDIGIQPNDVIIVPNSKTKTLAKFFIPAINGGLPRLFGL